MMLLLLLLFDLNHFEAIKMLLLLFDLNLFEVIKMLLLLFDLNHFEAMKISADDVAGCGDRCYRLRDLVGVVSFDD